MTAYTFSSKVVLGPTLPRQFTTDEVKNEPMLFNCDLGHAYHFGGPITREFLREFVFDMTTSGRGYEPDDLVFDGRVHMLMKGWYPCIPGFHHDDVPRNTYNKQPDYDTPSYRSKHAMLIVGDDVSRTQFALGHANFPKPEPGEVAYGKWHPLVEELVENGDLQSFHAPPGTIVYFNDRSWHQGTAATGSGWRFFIRASWDTDRKPTNEVRRQVQAYLPTPMEGW